jgi:hypothetical protein
LDRQDVFRGSTQQFEELIPPDVGCCSLHWRWAKTDKSCVLSSVWWVCVCVEELIHLTRRADSPWRPGTPRSTCHSSIFNSSHLFWVPSSQFQPVSTWPFFLCLGAGRTFRSFSLVHTTVDEGGGSIDERIAQLSRPPGRASASRSSCCATHFVHLKLSRISNCNEPVVANGTSRTQIWNRIIIVVFSR